MNYLLQNASRAMLEKLMKLLSHVWFFVTPWTVARQAPLSMEFTRQEYWSGLPFPSPGDLPDQGSNLGLLHYNQTLYHLSHQGSPGKLIDYSLYIIELLKFIFNNQSSPGFCASCLFFILLGLFTVWHRGKNRSWKKFPHCCPFSIVRTSRWHLYWWNLDSWYWTSWFKEENVSCTPGMHSRALSHVLFIRYLSLNAFNFIFFSN